MTRVASLVLMTHVDDQRFRTLGLDLEGRDQRVFGVDLDAVGVSFEPKSDGEMHRRLLDEIPGSAPSFLPKIRHSPRPTFPKSAGPGKRTRAAGPRNSTGRNDHGLLAQ